MTVVNDANVALIGRPLANISRHQANLFVHEQVGPARIGGVIYMGRRAGDPFGSDCWLPA